ncbi:MAG: winged helix-turn-helix domain-containing protein [Halobacteriales archaeon]|nr:winged helix-turn-helix domain-containing protein [Halobacteriales archaeon]
MRQADLLSQQISHHFKHVTTTTATYRNATRVSTSSDEETSNDDDPRSLLALLGDEFVQAILAATSDTPKSSKELSEELDVARSTIYRRVEEMLGYDLLIERTRVMEDGSHHSVYRANIDHLDIELVDGEFKVQVETRETPADRFTTLWEDIRET